MAKGGNTLHFGDNLDVLRGMPAEAVDLVYLDPPFNSNATYNVLYGTKRGGASQAQSHAFHDTWKWSINAKRALDETAERHLQAGALLDAFHKAFGDSTIMAYLAMMTVRLIEMYRVLKPSGSLYLHCDPTASHYLKTILDAIFGTAQFRNELVWQRSLPKGLAFTRFASAHDVILYYAKGEKPQWTAQYTAHRDEYVEKYYSLVDDKTGRRFQATSLINPNPDRPNLTYDFHGHKKVWRWTRQRMLKAEEEGKIYFPPNGGVPREKRFLDQMKGNPVSDVWIDIPPVNSQAEERIGYSTQKPLALLKRIIEASSKEGEIVLDPFCGCGTAIEAAETLKRQWIGIDITYLAIHVIEGRLAKAFGADIKQKYKLLGRPKDASDANALAARDWLEFQKWAVFTLGGLPKDRPGPDGGIDGIIRYHRVGIEQPGRAVVSVKGGLNVGVDAIHKLKSVVKREGAEMGVLVCVNTPTNAMLKEAASEGEIGPPSRRVEKLQILTVDSLFERNPIDLPGMLDPPEAVPSAPAFQPKRVRKKIEGQGELLFPISGNQLSEDPPRKQNRSIRAVEVEVTRPDRSRR